MQTYDINWIRTGSTSNQIILPVFDLIFWRDMLQSVFSHIKLNYELVRLGFCGGDVQYWHVGIKHYSPRVAAIPATWMWYTVSAGYLPLTQCSYFLECSIIPWLARSLDLSFSYWTYATHGGNTPELFLQLLIYYPTIYKMCGITCHRLLFINSPVVFMWENRAVFKLVEDINCLDADGFRRKTRFWTPCTRYWLQCATSGLHTWKIYNVLIKKYHWYTMLIWILFIAICNHIL